MAKFLGKRKFTARNQPYRKNRPLYPTRRRSAPKPGAMMQRHISGPRFHKIRMKVTENVSEIIVDGKDILSMLGVISTSNATARYCYQSGKVVYCKVVGIPPVTGQLSEIAMEFGGGSYSPSSAKDRIVNSSNNSTITPMIYGKPRILVPGSDFFTNTTNQLIKIEAPVNSIIEIGVMATEFQNKTFVPQVTGTFPDVYYLYKFTSDTNLEGLV